MLCEDCHQNQATVLIQVTTGDETTTRHLCPECMKKMEASFQQGDVQGFLSSLLSLLSNEPETPVLQCSGCGLTYEEFQRTGKLGCAQCYQAFQEQLRPLLLRIHGRSQHAGRTPDKPLQSNEACLTELRERMDQAVAVENFEEAARLRDEIRALTEQEENHHACQQ